MKELPLAGGRACDFQSRAESTAFQAVVLSSMRRAPQRVKTTGVVEWTDGHDRHVLEDVAAEEPLEIRTGGE
jgi:hypothetical protein